MATRLLREIPLAVLGSLEPYAKCENIRRLTVEATIQL